MCAALQRQVGQESGNSLAALFSIVKSDGVGGLFVGGKEQLIREIPFNAIQFTMYEVGVALFAFCFPPELRLSQPLVASKR